MNPFPVPQGALSGGECVFGFWLSISMPSSGNLLSGGMAGRLPRGCLTTSRVESAREAEQRTNAVHVPCPFFLLQSRSPLNSVWRNASFPSSHTFPLPNTMPKNTQNSNSASRHSLRRNQVQFFISPDSSCLFILLQGLPHLP
jgi:hypothetical protein